LKYVLVIAGLPVAWETRFKVFMVVKIEFKVFGVVTLCSGVVFY